MNRLSLIPAVIAALLSFCPAPVLAQTRVVVVDENGHGTIDGSPLTGAIAVEPFSGLSTLRYTLPFGFGLGDILLSDPLAVTPQNPAGITDLIRFSANSGMYFFSLVDSSPPDLADVPAFPPLLGVNVTVPTGGPDGTNVAHYTPSAAQPGGDPGGIGTRDYTFITAVPEPGVAMLACAGAGMILRRWKGASAGSLGVRDDAVDRHLLEIGMTKFKARMTKPYRRRMIALSYGTLFTEKGA